jgi:hypothetical protein
MVVLLVVVQTLAPERAWVGTATNYTAEYKFFDNKKVCLPSYGQSHTRRILYISLFIICLD